MKIYGTYTVHNTKIYETSFSVDATVRSQEDCQHLITFLKRIEVIYNDIEKWSAEGE